MNSQKLKKHIYLHKTFDRWNYFLRDFFFVEFLFFVFVLDFDNISTFS